MEFFILGAVCGALLVHVLVTGRVLGRKTEPAPTPSPAPPDPGPRTPYDLQQSVLRLPVPSTPDEMPDIPPFAELVDALSEVETDALLRFFTGSDAILAWAALAQLARRPRDPVVENKLLQRINDFHPWTRHYALRTLEAWNPADDSLAARVLFQLDESWNSTEKGVVLDEFLQRRAARGPVRLAGHEPPDGFTGLELRQVLIRQVDRSISGPLLEDLGDVPADPTPGAPGPAPEASLSDIGRLSPPRSVTDDGLLACPSADGQLQRLLAVLTGAPPRSILIAGEAGVGKTSLVRRAAARLSQQGWTIFEAGASQINAGMMFIGAVEQRIHSICQQLARNQKTLWLIPEFPQLLWSGRHLQSPIGILEMLLPAIESGEVLVLGEARSAALERVLVERPEVARLFEIVRLEPPPEPEVTAMLDAWAAAATERHRVVVPPGMRAEAVALARQYLPTQAPPGGALRLLQEALAGITRAGGNKGSDNSASPDGTTPLTMDDLVAALAQLTGLPLDLLDERRTLDLEGVRERFEARVIGQPEAVRCLVDRLALLKAGVTDPTRPTGVFLFAGGSGTGKTELAKTLAEYLFGAQERLLRLDMSELQDAYALERLVGNPQETSLVGTSLAERVRRQPFCVVLLDEFERAHPRVWDVFLQVFDDGRLTDRRGNTADFRNAIIILTSNVGTASAGEARLGLVDRGDGSGRTAVERAVQRTFRPELLNRLDRLIVFRPLTRDTMGQILHKELVDAFSRRGLRRRDWAIELEESATQLLIEHGFSPTLGARPLKRAVERLLLTPLAAAILDRSAPEGDQFLFVRADGDRLAVEFVDPDAPAERAAAPSVVADGTCIGLGSMIFDASGTAAEVESLRLALRSLEERVAAESWGAIKQALLLESSEPGFWERADRFERLGCAEYMDRIENGLRSAASLLERLQGEPGMLRRAYPSEMVRRLAQQLYLVEAAMAEALDTGPRDAFVSIQPVQDDTIVSGGARDFARRVEGMYATWARARGMRLVELGPLGEGAESPRVLAIAGFAAYALLFPEQGLHVFEWDDRAPKAQRRATVRVRVESQPPVPAREGAAGLRAQAIRAFAARAALPTTVVRRYREQPSPLVRDSVRGWRTGRIERVLGGDFDVIPVRPEA